MSTFFTPTTAQVLDAAGRLQQLERSLVDGVGGGIDTHKGNRKGSKSSKLGMQEPSAPGSWKGLAGSDSSRGACGEPGRVALSSIRITD